MATEQMTIDYLLDQLSDLPDVATRKMFGEYALYVGGKVVGLVCDDQLFIKPTGAGKAWIGTPDEVPPYNGAKPYYLVSGDHWEDRDWLAELVRQTATELPLPKPKKKAPPTRKKGHAS